MRANATGQRKAIGELQSLIGSLRESGESRVPSLRKLSRRFGVAYVTLSKAVHELVRHGVLRTVPGRGIFVADAPTGAASTEPAVECVPRRPAWHRVQAVVRQDLLRHAHAPGTVLPATKQLARTHGVAYRTMHKALDGLVRESMLLPHGNGYRAAELPGTGGHGTVVLVARGGYDLNQLSTRAQEFYRTVQSECARSNIMLRIVFFEYRLGNTLDIREDSRPFLDHPRENAVLGYLVFGRGMPEEFTATVVAQLARHQLPVSVLDESGDLPIALRHCSRNRVRRFSVSCTVQSGAAMGRFLVERGHRRVAYINPAHAATWSLRRLAGLRGTYAQAGYPDAVHEFVTGHVSGVPQHTYQTEALLKGATPVLRRAVRGLAMRITEELGKDAMSAHVAPLLDQTLHEPGLTAWVAANDYVAVQCLRFLQQHRVDVPAELSVVGFDDTLDAFLWKLTSYNHNFEAVIHAMLAHVLDPRLAPAPTETVEPVELAGFIDERETVAELKSLH